jgi:hypothetical protein
MEFDMTKHQKTAKPSDIDLRINPLIGGSKGVTMAGVTPDELEESEGANTFEGDVGSDTNPYGGIEKPMRRQGPHRRPPVTIAKAGKKHIGKGAHGKGAGSGANTDAPSIPDNMVLSNRDKARHPRDRGQDSRWVQSEQGQDGSANRATKRK